MRRRPGRDQDAKLAYAAGRLPLPVPFTLEGFRESMEHHCGREVHLTPFSVGSGGPSGVFLQTADVDNLCYQAQTSPFHQAHIVACLAARALLSDPPQLRVDPRLVPDVGPQLARLILGENAELAEVAGRGQAEAFAVRVLDRAGVCQCPALVARRLHRALAPLHAALAEAVPGVVRPHPAGIPGSAGFRLYWRVVEVRDAMLTLRPYGDPPAAAGPATMQGSGRDADDAALIEARLLASGVEAKRAGLLPWPPTTQEDMPGGAIDLQAEAQGLARVALAYTRLRGDGASGHCGPASSRSQ